MKCESASCFPCLYCITGSTREQHVSKKCNLTRNNRCIYLRRNYRDELKLTLLSSGTTAVAQCHTGGRNKACVLKLEMLSLRRDSIIIEDLLINIMKFHYRKSSNFGVWPRLGYKSHNIFNFVILKIVRLQLLWKGTTNSLFNMIPHYKLDTVTYCFACLVSKDTANN